MIFDFEKVAGGFREVGGQNHRCLMRRLSTETVFRATFIVKIWSNIFYNKCLCALGLQVLNALGLQEIHKWKTENA